MRLNRREWIASLGMIVPALGWIIVTYLIDKPPIGTFKVNYLYVNTLRALLFLCTGLSFYSAMLAIDGWFSGKIRRTLIFLVLVVDILFLVWSIPLVIGVIF